MHSLTGISHGSGEVVEIVIDSKSQLELLLWYVEVWPAESCRCQMIELCGKATVGRDQLRAGDH